jgi:hypothetical protein
MTMMTQHERFINARCVPQYEVDTLGAPFKVTLFHSVTLGIDPTTGEEKVNIPDVVGLINCVVRARVSHPRKLNGDELKFVRSALGVKANALAAFLEMSPEHLSRCEAGAKIMSTISERFFRLFAFLATFFPDPEELLIKTLDGSEIERKAKKPNEMGKKFAQQFISMKIQSVYDSDEELNFEFWREQVGPEDTCGPTDESSEWKDEPKQMLIACGR